MPNVSSTLIVARSFQVRCDSSAVREVCLQMREVLAGVGAPEAELAGWELALAEAANNAVHYTPLGARELLVQVDLVVTPDQVEVRITDHTPGFDWPVNVELPADDSERGRGIFLIQNLTDSAEYLRGRGENCLVLRKKRAARLPIQCAPPPPDASAALKDAQHTLDLMTEELASSYESLAAIFSFSAELQGSRTSDEFIQRWLSQLLTITDSDWFILRLSDPASRHLRVAAASTKDWRSEPLALTAKSTEGGSVEVSSALQRKDIWFDAGSPLAPSDPLSRIAGDSCGFAHPLVVNDSLVGILSIGRHDREQTFRAGHVNVVHTFGDFLGLQLRSTQMQEEQLRMRLNKRDLEIAANLQRTLLPERLPSVPGATLSGFYRSAREIGGDYYDALAVEDGNVLLIVADVMGKGLPAALFGFMFRSLVRARRDLASRPGEFLAWLNQNLFQELDQAEMFITARIAYLDFRRGLLQVAGAGHPPMLVMEASGQVAELSSGGPPLGIVWGANFPEESRPWTVARALMFTDGLIEARNVANEMLGVEAVKSELAASARAGDSADAARHRLVRRLQEFEQGTPPADDTAFIVIANTETK